MNKPKMILFDYGGTLMYETNVSPANGNKAIYPYISENPHQITLEEFSDYLLKLFDEIRALRGELIEIHEHTFLRHVLEHFDLKLSVSMEEAEWIIWNGVANAQATPGAAEMLNALHSRGIRTGIISNLCWSGEALTRRIRETFPAHPFEFILTSSDYIFRKPDPHIFEMAIRKSGLRADEIWFVGNEKQVDIIGAKNAGLFPVFYDDRTFACNARQKNENITLDFEFLGLDSWNDLVEALKLDCS